MLTRILAGGAKLASSSLLTIKTRIFTNAARPSLLTRNFSSLLLPKTPTLFRTQIAPSLTETITRNVTKYSFRKGKRKSVKTVLSRFYRLQWGGWIRRFAGCHKRLWKKRPRNRQKLKRHVLCNSTQSWMLDKMVGPYWRKPRYYIDDPYEPYHSREEFDITARKPKPYFPPENEM